MEFVTSATVGCDYAYCHGIAVWSLVGCSHVIVGEGGREWM